MMEPNKKTLNRDLSLIILFLAILIVSAVLVRKYAPNLLSLLGSEQKSSTSAFEDNFQKNGEIEETAKMSESSNPDWWVNSGGVMEISGGTAKTVQGDLPEDSKWAKKYASNNPEDTDDGAHPQNIFRLVARGKWENFRQEAYFKINKMNFSASENRNESNGILLFNRYEDGDNLYYTGLRVDGSAVIKKKYGGKYYTLNEKEYFSGAKYNLDENPNLLPLGVWIGLRSEFRNTSSGDVEIKLFAKDGKDGQWKLAASVTDDGRKEFGKNILSDAGHAGIRTDFMDVEFSDYKIIEF